MKKIIVLFTVILMLTACQNTAGSNTNSGKIIINMPTAATTGSLYPLGSSIANLWNEKLSNIKATAQASNGGIENLNLLQSEEANVSMAVISNIYQSYKGLEKFEGRANSKIRIIAGLYYNPNQIVVSSSSSINSFLDIKGKKFATGAPGSTSEDEARVHFISGGINYPEGIKAEFVGFTEAVDLMRNKQIDGAWIMAGIPTAAVTEMLLTADAKLIDVPDDVFDKLKEEYPWYAKYKIPENTYSNQEYEINTTAIKMAIFTTEDMSEEVVYELTKTFWENIEVLKETNKSLENIKLEETLDDIADLPIHKGAERYYKEIGVLK